MKRQLISFLFFTSFVIACGQTHRLSEEDFKWMPYKGNETLVFKSNTGERDTIFLLKKDTLLAYPEAQSSNGIKYEVVSIFSKHTDPTPPNGKHRYLENNFLEIQRGNDNRTEMNILLSAKDAKFYKLNSIRIDSLNKQKPSTLQTSSGQYDDIYIINGRTI
jgi:hypothetical protein